MEEHSKPVEAQLQGLSRAQVAERVARGQTNAYKERTSRSAAQILRANVLTIFNAILGVALVVVLVVGNWRDALFGFVLLLNTATGTVAEVRAKRALDRLAVLDAPSAYVVREGQETQVDVADIVLDDVLRLRSGQQVPADGVVLETSGLEVDESILTGESVAVRPAAGGRVMSGTTVTAGSALVRTTAVGDSSYAHRLAREARRYSVVTSELQQGTNRVLGWISWVIVPVALLLVWSQMRQLGGVQQALAGDQWRVALVAGVAGVVGMVPQGLVLLTSVNFATASMKLARQRVLVQELPAVEVLARVDTLCLDKTGTITTGGITLSEVLPLAADGSPCSAEGADGSVPGEVVEALAALAGGEARNATAEAIGEALAAGRLGEAGRTAAPQPEQSVPFSSARKWSAVRVDGVTWVLGAPEIVLGAAEGQAAARCLEAVQQIADGGVRVVGLARSAQDCRQPEAGEAELPPALCPAALVVLTEQVRPDASQTLAYFREQGVRAKVISGDNPTTVAAVARRAGLTREDGEPLVALDARELPADESDPQAAAALAQAIEDADVLGRVTPEQKRAFVRVLKAGGHVVAMTGDGVNDALALKDADLGIAMGNGAPATKAVARLVLLNGEFSALPGVVAEGRRVMANTERIASLFLSKTVYASLIAVVVSITAIAYPFLPRQLTIVSSLTIGVPAFVLALAPSRRRYQEGFLARVLSLAVPAGLLAGTCTLAAHTWLVWSGVDGTQVTTGSTLVLVACGLALLTLTARPLLGWRLGLILLMGVLAVLGVLVPQARDFFSLAWPTEPTWLIVGTMTGCALTGMGLVSLVQGRVEAWLGLRVGDQDDAAASPVVPAAPGA
ncbi:HAD-IC family P-type ATPase [Actinomyces weissii]|uniref:HAD-IC family P-type ATPase n=1 Tax=Actinomyces weissii TaxID=675090 RepID=A0A7T7M8W8_9ACTO|nr:HAD-IC family P-type ATPase [Actinomyces weissii]QQM66587.1 HAD-IC family P-type ATPase [Actinomyces weissii]